MSCHQRRLLWLRESISVESKNEINKERIPVFLSDEPLSEDREQEYRFGHPALAEELKSFVQHCPEPFIIGLFGKWGSGKTSILNLLRKKLGIKPEEKNITVVNFDIWKYDKSDLLQVFLKEADRQLEVPDALNERVKNSFQKIQTDYRWSRLPPQVKLYFCLIVLFVVLIYLFFWERPAILASLALVFPFLINFATKILFSSSITSIYERYTAPHEFENEFFNLLKNIGEKRILFIIDNLDRCAYPKAVELLSTLKTFFSKDDFSAQSAQNISRPVFLIACDDVAIKEQIMCSYTPSESDNSGKKKTTYADEFLRKFFNTYIRIPDFIDKDLDSFTEELLKAIENDDFDPKELSHVISCAFRDSPRQIKQFINTLIAAYHFAKNREEKKDLTRGIVTEHLPVLAKVMIVRQLFNGKYKEMLKTHQNFGEMMGKFRNKNKDQRSSSYNETEEFMAFLEATEKVDSPNIRPFLYIKHSEAEIGLPEIVDMEIALKENNVEAFKNLIKDLDESLESDKQKAFKDFLGELFDKCKENYPVLFSIINCILKSYEDLDAEIDEDIRIKIEKILGDDKGALKKRLLDFDAGLIFRQLLRYKTEDSGNIIDEYLRILNQEQAPEDEAIPILKELLEEKMFEELLDDETKKGNFKKLVKKYIALTIEAIPQRGIKTIDPIKEKIDFIEKSANFAGNAERKELFKKLKRLLILTPNFSKEEKKQNMLGQLVRNFYIFSPKQLNEIPVEIEALVDTLLQNVSRNENDYSKIMIYIPLAIKLSEACQDSARKEKLESLINRFFSSSNIHEIIYVLGKLDEQRKKMIIQSHQKLFVKGLEDFVISSLNPEESRIVVEILFCAIEQADDSTDVRKHFGMILQLRCAGVYELKHKLSKHILRYLHNPDKSKRELGYISFKHAQFLPEELKENIKNVINLRFRVYKEDREWYLEHIQGCVPISDELPKEKLDMLEQGNVTDPRIVKSWLLREESVHPEVRKIVEDWDYL